MEYMVSDSIGWIYCVLGTIDRDNFCHALWILSIELIPHPLFLTDDVRPDGMPTTIK